MLRTSPDFISTQSGHGSTSTLVHLDIGPITASTLDHWSLYIGPSRHWTIGVSRHWTNFWHWTNYCLDIGPLEYLDIRPDIGQIFDIGPITASTLELFDIGPIGLYIGPPKTSICQPHSSKKTYQSSTSTCDNSKVVVLRKIFRLACWGFSYMSAILQHRDRNSKIAMTEDSFVFPKVVQCPWVIRCERGKHYQNKYSNKCLWDEIHDDLILMTKGIKPEIFL